MLPAVISGLLIGFRSLLMPVFLFSLLLLCCLSSSALAHFGAIIPAKDIVSAGDSLELRLEVKFLHPFEGHVMEMAKPQKFGVFSRGEKFDLTAGLQKQRAAAGGKSGDFTFWSSDFHIKRPGDHTFYVEPQPYWEPAEDLFIVHYTKVCVSALGLEDSWDQPLGLETEIVPLTRPYGLWTNNLFSGQVLLKGEPVPYAEIEVEYLNESPENRAWVNPPAAPYITQVIKADANGIFHYAMPRAGWWGFSALSEADWTLQHEGAEKLVEIGAVYWVRTRDMQ